MTPGGGETASSVVPIRVQTEQAAQALDAGHVMGGDARERVLGRQTRRGHRRDGPEQSGGEGRLWQDPPAWLSWMAEACAEASS